MFRFIVMALSCFRLSHFLVYERGPANVMEKVRENFGVIYYKDDNALASSPNDGGIGDALSCIYCTSFWVSIGVLAVEGVSSKVNDVLAISAATILVKELIDHGES